MKKIFLLSALLMTAIYTNAQKSKVAAKTSTAAATLTNTRSTEIKGTLKSRTAVKEISLMDILDGEPKVLATTTLAEDGAFDFTFKPSYEGFYAIGSADMMKGQFPVYLKAGDVAEVNIDNYDITFTANNTPENTVLAAWSNLSKNLKRKSVYFMGANSTYVDFFPELTAVAAQADEFKKTIQTKNKKFNLTMKEQVDFDLDFYAINMLRTPRSAHPSKDQYPAYYSTIVVKNKFPNDNVLNTLYGKRYMAMYVDFAAEKDWDMNKRMTSLSTDRQKGEYALYNLARGMKSYDKYEIMIKDYGQYFQTASQKKTIEELRAKLSKSKSGGIATDFSYPDQDGKMVSLSGQKGKVVLVDVWATWCGPCKQQIPALKQLEKEMHGKDIVIMSVSVDVEKDKDKWLNMIKEQSLGGVQLFAGGGSKIAKDYEITGIPRFMVFDKKGNIVSIDAPRPTAPELKALLEAELNK